MKKLLMIVIVVFIVMFQWVTHMETAIAECQVNLVNYIDIGSYAGKPEAWQKAVQTSNDRDLRNAWQSGKCEIVKGGHKGGSKCIEEFGSMHITVRLLPGATAYQKRGAYHVFNYYDGKEYSVAPTKRNCTTFSE